MKRNFLILCSFVKRGFLVFIKDKASVFFSVFAPLIILLLYILFLKQVQVDSLSSAFKDIEISSKMINAIADNWMLAGVISVSCITVSFSATGLMVADREAGITKDFYSSPVKKGIITLGYYVYNFVVTLFICLFVLAVIFIYLAITGWFLSGLDVLMIFLTTLVSILLSSIIGTIIASFIRSLAAHSGIIGILSASSGFVIGAYMPIAIFPKFIQYIILFIPNTYSGSLFRNYFLERTLAKLGEQVPPAIVDELIESYSLKLDFFGQNIGTGEQWLILGACLLVSALIACAISYFRNNKKLVRLNLKRSAK